MKRLIWSGLSRRISVVPFRRPSLRVLPIELVPDHNQSLRESSHHLSKITHLPSPFLHPIELGIELARLTDVRRRG
jgi:hypothetical protein